jgi:ferredoxin
MTRPDYLAVDPIACHAHGLCAEMLPDLIRLDEWGYPLLPADPIPRRRRRDVRAAMRACPTLALGWGVAGKLSIDESGPAMQTEVDRDDQDARGFSEL